MSEAGKRGIYREDDWKAIVQVLEDNSDEEWKRFKLRVIRTLAESRIYNPTADGEEFEVSHLRNGGSFSGMWRLDTNDPEAQL